ncbi:hypothetical protein Micbo1qcDRAFT_215987 [Microdochium bolleyi]|uniref:C2H2-type domain-containing protein n=1 Tax=Microdochium bolleyi TaxID=196109 RepID=A0A136IS15_9PEZI|nr:hypothetical protein Micbo1qcDRAFT_215987 [Microdochium bolleyi]
MSETSKEQEQPAAMAATVGDQPCVCEHSHCDERFESADALAQHRLEAKHDQHVTTQAAPHHHQQHQQQHQQHDKHAIVARMRARLAAIAGHLAAPMGVSSNSNSSNIDDENKGMTEGEQSGISGGGKSNEETNGSATAAPPIPSTKPLPFVCGVCDRRFSKPKALGQHMTNLKHGEAHRCRQCKKFFSTARGLGDHGVSSGHDTGTYDKGSDAVDCADMDGLVVVDGNGGAVTDAASSASSSWTHVASHENTHANDGDEHGSGELEDELATAFANDLSIGASVPIATSSSSSSSSSSASAGPATTTRDEAEADTPLNCFFSRFEAEGFSYDPRAPPSVSFAQLKKHLGQSMNGLRQQELKGLWLGLQAAIDDELVHHYGTRGDLAAWQALCRAVLPAAGGVGGDVERKSITACRKALRTTHVNIFDLVAFARHSAATTTTAAAATIDGDSGTSPANSAQEPVQIRTFTGMSALRRHSRAQQKMFPLCGGARACGDKSAGLAAFLRPFNGRRAIGR